MRTLPLIAFAAVATVSCADEPTAPAGGLEIATAAAFYEAGEPIVAILENRSTTPAYVQTCNHRISFVVERRLESGWTEYRGVDGPACLAIYPSGTRGLHSFDFYRRDFELSEPGTYRLRIDYGETETTVGGRANRSPAFAVR